MNTLAVRELPNSEQPRYRARSYGMGSLSSGELLQLIASFTYLNTSSELLARAGSLTELARMSIEELCETEQVGPAAATAIKAALELGRRLVLEPAADRPQIKTGEDAANLMMLTLGLEEQEHLVVLMLDTRNRVLAQETVYKGNINSCVIRVGEIFRAAIDRRAAAIIVVHNHPSGDPTPSYEDVAVTEQIVQAGRLLNIEVIDHLIIGHQRYVSLKARGLGFN